MLTSTSRINLTRSLRLITAMLILGTLLLTFGAPQPAYADAINDAFQGCGVLTFDSDAQGFRTASTRENRTVNAGPFDAPHTAGNLYFRWESTGGNPSGHLRADDFDGEYQEVWTPVFADPNFSGVIGQQTSVRLQERHRLQPVPAVHRHRRHKRQPVLLLLQQPTGRRGHLESRQGAHGGQCLAHRLRSQREPSTPPDSPAPSNADFAAVLGNLDRFAISVEGVSGSDTSRFDNFGRACDYGDLPESGTSFVTTGANAARHNIADEVRLGALIDSEPNGLPGPLADGDDLSNTDDEDAWLPCRRCPPRPPTMSSPWRSLNTSGRAGTVYGWIDFNGKAV